MSFLTPTRSRHGTFMRSPLGVRYRMPMAFPVWSARRAAIDEETGVTWGGTPECGSLRSELYPYWYDEWKSRVPTNVGGAFLRTRMEYQYRYQPWKPDPWDEAYASYSLYRSVVRAEVSPDWEGRKVIGLEMGAVTDAAGDGARIEVANYGASTDLDSYPTGHGFDVVANPDRDICMLDNPLEIGHEYWPEPPEIWVFIHFPKPFPGVYEPHCAEDQYEDVLDEHQVQINFADAALILD